MHRDVKPSNLLVMGPPHRPRVKLSDFGLAKSFDETEGFTTLTRQGDIGGSIGFISPDHIRDFSEVREPADIYSAGATLFYLLTNRYPYLGFDPRQPARTRSSSRIPPVPLRAFRPDAPEGLERILLKALQKQPRDRWKSAQAMADALRPFLLPDHGASGWRPADPSSSRYLGYEDTSLEASHPEAGHSASARRLLLAGSPESPALDRTAPGFRRRLFVGGLSYWCRTSG